MLIDWIHWVQSLRPVELISMLGVLLLVDGARYALSSAAMVVVDLGSGLLRRVTRHPRAPRAYTHRPSVCVLIAGHNEAGTIDATLDSLWNSYPNMQIIVIDDGSRDGMADVARQFARQHHGVRVLSRPQRGGKSSALNWGYSQARADVIVTLDADSRLGPNAVWEIVQPLHDPLVGAVSGTITVWNAACNLVTWLQAYEYRQGIFLGRQLQSRLGTLGIVSGAFGAFRPRVLQRVGGWDAGGGEDGDLTLRIRKAGYRIEFAHHAECLTNAPLSWRHLFRQRMRWDRAVVTFECRKHVDLGRFWERHFEWTNFLCVVERWMFNVVFVFGYWIGLVWLCWSRPDQFVYILLLLYLCQLGLELITVGALLFYSNRCGRDLGLAFAIPFVPCYQMFLKVASLSAVVAEWTLRSSQHDDFVPKHVRDATWKW